MKISPSTFHIAAVLLAVGSATAFVPNSCKVGHGNVASTTTTCFVSEVDTEGTSASTSSPKFPFSDRQVRFAYDEWRLIYGKGDFDPVRFNNFKTNHKTLVISNLKAREKAEQDGRPMPQWMSLNEYGDYSIDEYEKMLRGEDPVANGDVSVVVSEGLETGEAVVRGTQAIGETVVRGTQAIHSDSSMNYSNGQVVEYQDAFGRTIRSTQAVNSDASLESAAMTIDSNYANNIDDTRGTLIIPKEETGTQVITDTGTARGTQVVSQAGGTQSIRGTQPISSSEGRGTQVVSTGGGTQPIRGTQPISGGGGRGTQVVSTSGMAQPGGRGTQVVSTGGGTQPIRGTQPINGGGARGTQVVQSSGGFGTRPVGSRGTQKVGSESYGTQPLQSPSNIDDDEEMDYDPNAGTQIIPKNEGGTQKIPNGATGGTQVVSTSDTAGTGAGTMVVEKVGEKDEEEEDGISKFFRILFSEPKTKEKSEDVPEPVGKRGTMVIKRSIKAPERKKPKSIFSLFDSDSKGEEEEQVVEEPEEPKSSNFFDFLATKDESAEVETKATEVEEEKPEGGIFTLFGGNVKSANPRPVRTSISLQKQAPKKSISVSSRRQTKLIPDEAENETGMPSILSFFGGAKKVDEEETARNPKSRPTLIVKKPKTVQSQFSSFFKSKKTEETTPAKDTTPTTSSKNPVSLAIQKLDTKSFYCFHEANVYMIFHSSSR